MTKIISCDTECMTEEQAMDIANKECDFSVNAIEFINGGFAAFETVSDKETYDNQR
jgi:hypothetical protein